MRPEHMLTDRDLDEVDLLLIPVSAGIARVRAYLDAIGIARGQQLLVIRDRLDVTKAILAECEHDYQSKAVH